MNARLDRSITLWQSYVGKGAPLNGAGERTGYGATKGKAHACAAHWNNQAPYARCRRVTITDQARATSLLTEDEQHAHAICSSHSEMPVTAIDREIRALLADGKFASAVIRYYETYEQNSREHARLVAEEYAALRRAERESL